MANKKKSTLGIIMLSAGVLIGIGTIGGGAYALIKNAKAAIVAGTIQSPQSTAATVTQSTTQIAANTPATTATPTTSSPAPTTTNGLPLGTIMVQFAAKDSKVAADALYQDLLKKFPALVKDHQYAILEEKKNKTIYRLQIAYNKKEDARTAATEFKKNKVDCIVPVTQSYVPKKPNT
jgi:type IV secretory pathway VirJ component